MSHFLTKRGFRGFTLIELLVVIAIIGLLATVIAAPITEARKKGRDAKKIADIRSITTALALYYDDNGGQYPTSLSGLVPRYLPNLPSNAQPTTIPRDKYMYVYYTDTGNGATSTVAYHLGVKLESPNQALNDDADCDSIGDASTTATGGSSKFCVGSSAASNAALRACSSPTACTSTFSNIGSETGGAVVTGNNDFEGGSDTGTTQCTSALNQCVYDIVN